LQEHAEDHVEGEWVCRRSAIASAWTSRPTNSTLGMSNQFLLYAALHRWICLFYFFGKLSGIVARAGQNDSGGVLGIFIGAKRLD